MEITHLSLFSGIGGLDLAAEWAGIKTVGQCEWADYPTKVLQKHWPDVPRWKDIRTLTKESFYERTGRRTVDIISGGFPCQPFSVAGKQRGKEDDRYLWPEMVRVIKELRPYWVIGENVAGIVRMALPDILFELEACGYRTRAFLIPACAVGARHRRYRVAIVAHSGHDVLQGWEYETEKGKRTTRHEPEPCRCGGTKGEPEQEPERPVCNVSNTDNGSRDVRRNRALQTIKETGRSGSDFGKGEKEHEPEERRPTKSLLGGMADGLPAGMDGDFLINHYWDVEPGIPRIATGIEHRVGRLKCLGNAVVPQQFYQIFKAIAEIEGRKNGICRENKSIN